MLAVTTRQLAILVLLAPTAILPAPTLAEESATCRVGTKRDKKVAPKDYTTQYFDFRYEPAAKLGGHFHKNKAGYLVLDQDVGGGRVSPTDAEKCGLGISAAIENKSHPIAPTPEQDLPALPVHPATPTTTTQGHPTIQNVRTAEPSSPQTAEIPNTNKPSTVPEQRPTSMQSANHDNTQKDTKIPFVMMIFSFAVLTLLLVIGATLIGFLASFSSRYVDKILLKDEKIIYKARIHWIWYVKKQIAGLSLLGLLLLLIGGYIQPGDEGTNILLILAGAVLCVIALHRWFKAHMERSESDVIITDRRVIYKYGLITGAHTHIFIDEIESCTVTKDGILGNIFNFGSVVFKGVAETKFSNLIIGDPPIFDKYLNEARDLNRRLR